MPHKKTVLGKLILIEYIRNMIILNRNDLENMFRNVMKSALESLEPEQKQEFLQGLIALIESIQDETE